MQTKSIQELFQKATRFLRNSDIDDIDLTVLFTIEHVFSDRYVNLLGKDNPVTKEKEDQVLLLLNACKNGQPLAYVLGSAEFNGCLYAIQEGVLIPRPETEELVEIAVALLNKEKANLPLVFECGVGSGVISLELAKQFQSLRFYAWDISPVAIETTRTNMKRMAITNVTLELNDFFKGVVQHMNQSRHVMIVSNPPYVAESEYYELDIRVKCEPKQALVADHHGLAVIFNLLRFSIHHHAILLCEIGAGQRSQIMEAFPNQNVIVLSDLTGHNRFLCYIPEQLGGIRRFANELGI